MTTSHVHRQGESARLLTGDPAVKPISTDVRLRADDVTLKYDTRVVAEGLSVAIPDESLTIIIGPNACGKSTLLRSLSRLLKPAKGQILLDGEEISTYRTKEVARRLGLLPQSSTAPDGLVVADLVGRGRFPHQRALRQWTEADERAVERAMEETGVSDLASRYVDELSGGQRQRVWLAMALAQETSLLLLDEPTTYLDISHQIEVLNLCARLQRSGGRTVVVVLHELNLAVRYATHLIVMREGRILAEGAPRDIVTAELVKQTFDLDCIVIDDPEVDAPMIIPSAKSMVGADRTPVDTKLETGH